MGLPARRRVANGTALANGGEPFNERPLLREQPPGVWDVSFTMPAMNNLASVLNQLEQERNLLASQLERLNNAISALNPKGSSRRGRVSAAGRARWAKVKGQKVVSIGAHKRKMSAAARKKIAAAQRARWAKWRKEKRTA
jgi:peptidoglycan hydrolase CwlO-like protein